MSALPEEAAGYVTILYLGPVVARRDNSSLRDLVADEIAQVVLGHFDRGGHANEAATDAMTTAWGFRRSGLGRRSSARSEEAPFREIHAEDYGRSTTLTSRRSVG